MKKHLIWIVSLIMVITMSFTACGSDTAGDDSSSAEQKVAVGISWCEDIDQDEHGEDLQAYINSVEKAGGEAVLLPLVKDQEEAKAELENVDALIMTGGEDIDPSYYGEEPDSNLEDVNEERDISDMAMMQEAIDEDMPTLCTCRGLQVLNVVSGGTLVQDIPTSEEFADSAIQHRDPAEEDFTYHVLDVEEDSILAGIIGDMELEANSWHHQGIKDVGDNLKVTAKAEDGMIEAIERDDCSYVIGVQFHPEWHVEEGNDSYLVFFEDLMAQAE